MIIRDDIDEARRCWAIAKAVQDAEKRATTPQVREALSEAHFNALGVVPDEYRYGRIAAATHQGYQVPPTGLALAGWCDEMLARLRGES